MTSLSSADEFEIFVSQLVSFSAFWEVEFRVRSLMDNFPNCISQLSGPGSEEFEGGKNTMESRMRRKISFDNPCLLRLRRRREILSSLKQDLATLSWKAFRLHREEQVAQEFIVEPIIKSLVEAATSFGAGHNIVDFSSLLRPSSAIVKNVNVAAKSKFYGIQWRRSKLMEDEEDHGDRMLPTAPKVMTVALTNSSRAVLVTSLKLKRLSLYEPKRIVNLRERVQILKGQINGFQLSNDEEKALESKKVINPLVSSIVDIAYLRGCVHKHFANIQRQSQDPESEEELSSDLESEEASSAFDCGSSMGVDEKMYNFFSNMELESSKVDDKQVQTDAAAPESVEKFTQVDADHEQSMGLLVCDVPAAIKSFARIAPFFEAYGAISKLEVTLMCSMCLIVV